MNVLIHAYSFEDRSIGSLEHSVCNAQDRPDRVITIEYQDIAPELRSHFDTYKTQADGMLRGLGIGQAVVKAKTDSQTDLPRRVLQALSGYGPASTLTQIGRAHV